MAPRADAVLWRDGLTGALLGALAHEAQHVRGRRSVPGYGTLPLWQREGEADRDADALLRGPLQAAPRLEAGRRLRLRLRDGEVECAGRVVVHIQPGRGRLGLGVHDSAADFVLHRPDATTR